VPIGHCINPNIAMVCGFSCHRDAEEARRRGLDGFRFFTYGLGHHYGFGEHKPGRTSVWDAYQRSPARLDERMGTGGIGTPAMVRAHLEQFRAAGVDQVTFIQQGGRNRHEHICESLTLFAEAVMPEFAGGEAERERTKLAELAPYLEQAMARKQRMRELADEEIPALRALGRQIIADGADHADAEEAWLRKRAERIAEQTRIPRKSR
jgi:hypothetical protein